MPYTIQEIKNIENKWQELWEKQESFKVKVDNKKQKFYLYTMPV